jgi:class 3 adenylate cyclase
MDHETRVTMPTKTATEWLAEVRRCESEAELFRAYDLAWQGLEEYPEDAPLKHRAVLCLASTGASARAAEEFQRLNLGPFAGDAPPDAPSALVYDIASLEARLLKDEAVATTGPERKKKLLVAGDAYEAVYRRMRSAGDAQSYYPGINCATLRLLAGLPDAARSIAGQILSHLAAWPSEKKAYYEFATELEANLINGDVAAARAVAGTVAALVREAMAPDYRALATTIRQLRLLVEATGIGAEINRVLSPPHVIHYLGHIMSPPGDVGRFPASEEEAVRRQIDARIAKGDIGFAYGSLAAGADILFAEAILEAGANLHVVLPFEVEEFVEVSVRPAGPGWVERFHRCFNSAATKRFATTERYLGDDSLFGYCSQLAMGRALLRANHICAQVEQIAVWDGKPSAGPGGTAADVALWRRAGMPQTIIPVECSTHDSSAAYPAPRKAERRTRAMLFGDIKGFSKLTDEQLPRFIDTVLGAFARVIDGFGDDVLLANTWGDGLFLVFDDAGKAAACALSLQEAMAGVDLAGAGLPDTMALRLGGHLGPVYAAIDPILRRNNFFGAHVSRAARIEPVTPEKLVYVTETLAAVLALHNAEAFVCNYVGMTTAAKDFGEMRMFLLARKPTRKPGGAKV